MGGGGGTNTVEKQSKPSKEETELLKLQVAQETALAPQKLQQAQQQLGLQNKILSGDANLPGFLGDVSQGLSQAAIDEIVKQSLVDITPSFQKIGVLDSGVAAEISARTSGDIRRAAYEYNLNNKYNLLNLALGGQAQLTGGSSTSGLMNSLAGLRGATSTSSSTIGAGARAASVGGGALSGAQAGSTMSGGNPWATAGGAIVGAVGGYYGAR